MANREENNHWNDHENIREKAKASLKKFLSPTRGEMAEDRPLNPDLVARVTQASPGSNGREVGAPDIGFDEEDNHEERMVRPTERDRINRAPNTIYPG